MGKLSGQCLCGSVRYDCDADPIMTAACHCTHCQRQTGTEFSVIVGVPADSISIHGDSLKTYEDTGTSGMPTLRKFCGECGSPIMTDVKAYEGILFIKAGTLDVPTNVNPELEIWCDSKIGWANLGDNLANVPGNPPPS